MRYEIRSPMWKGRCVGIAEYKLTEYNHIEILYRDAGGNLLHPHVYGISKSRAKTYPTHVTQKGKVTLRVIPIADLDVCEEKGDQHEAGKSDRASCRTKPQGGGSDERKASPEACKSLF
jgi:hypothetical protein